MSDNIIEQLEQKMSNPVGDNESSGGNHDIEAENNAIDVTGDEDIYGDSSELADRPVPIEDGEQSKDAESDHKTRKEKKRERGALHRALQEKEAQLAAQAERISRLEGVAQGYSQQQQQAPQGPDPYEVQIQKVHDEMQAIQQQSVGMQEGPALENLRHRHRELDGRKIELHQQRGMERFHVEQQRQQQSAQQQQGLEADRAGAIRAMNMMTEEMYGDVVSDPEASAYAYNQYQVLAKQPGMDPVRARMESLRMARKEFGLAGVTPPDESARARFSGSGRGVSGNSGRRTYTPNQAEISIARATYPDLSPAEAVQKWVNTTGKRLAANRA